jgi:hypothetical protein
LLRLRFGDRHLLRPSSSSIIHGHSLETIAELGGKQQGVVQGAVTSASSPASIAGLVVGGGLYPALGGDLFFIAAGLFAVVMVLTPLWFPRAHVQ